MPTQTHELISYLPALESHNNLRYGTGTVNKVLSHDNSNSKKKPMEAQRGKPKNSGSSSRSPGHADIKGLLTEIPS